MSRRLCFIFLAFCFGLALSGENEEAKPTLWALLVAGSNYWYNYRHQADVCHAYQILHAHGIPDEKIVVMMYDDIANNTQNPTQGVIINHINGSDVYKGVPKDYVGEDVTPENFMKVLLGDKEAMKSIGSGKVIESGPNDHVFVNFVDHGATGIVAFPVGELTAKQLNDTIKQLHKEKRYGKLVFYIEACESGSMFRNILPTNINVFATTAADYDESSYACYYDDERATYLGDVYSVNWMEDSDKEDIEKETLQQQFSIVKKETNTSHCKEFGDLSIGKMTVGEFQGEEAAPPKTYPKVPFTHVAPSWEVPLDILYKKLSKANSESEQEATQLQIENMIDRRNQLELIFKKIVSRVATDQKHEQRLTQTRPTHLTQLDCHHKLVKAFSRYCFDFGQNTYALKYAYILANICESGADAEVVIRKMRQVCKAITVTERID